MRREGTRDGGREETVEGGQETKGRREAAVDHEDALGDDGGEGQQLEELLEHHKHRRVVLARNLLVEAAANLRRAAVHLKVLVVAAVDAHAVRVEQHE